MKLGAAHLAVMTNAELVSAGVDREEVTAQRERMTGHVRRIAKPYIRSIGWWGGIVPLTAIADHLGREIDAVRNFAKSRSLRWQTKSRSFTPAQLAVRCLATPGPARDAAGVLGVFAVEVVLYRSALTELLVETETNFAELITWRPSRLEAEWRRLGLRIEAPQVDDRVSLHDPEFLRDLVERAEQMVAAGELEDG